MSRRINGVFVTEFRQKNFKEAPTEKTRKRKKYQDGDKSRVFGSNFYFENIVSRQHGIDGHDTKHREHDHDSLGKVEHAGGLVDQNEAQRDQ